MPRRYDQELFSIMSAIADSVETRSDADVMAESREAGEDPRRIAHDVRGRIREVVRQFDQRHRGAAKTSSTNVVAKLKQSGFNLDTFSIQELRELLQAVFTQLPQSQGLITVQCREYKDLPDDEVKSIVRQLQTLGVLDKLFFK